MRNEGVSNGGDWREDGTEEDYEPAALRKGVTRVACQVERKNVPVAVRRT
jgi:hypothetical protein